MVSFNFIDFEKIKNLDKNRLRLWLANVIKEEGKQEGNLNYLFCSDMYLHKINMDFLNHDTLTDIITFPNTEVEEIISGDIYLSVDRVVENSNELKVDFQYELNRVIVHGVLHLTGYKDKSDEEASLMRSKENYYLKKY